MAKGRKTEAKKPESKIKGDEPRSRTRSARRAVTPPK